MNEEVFDEIVVRYDLKAARKEVNAQIERVLDCLGAARSNLDRLDADVVDLIERTLARMTEDGARVVAWLTANARDDA